MVVLAQSTGNAAHDELVAQERRKEVRQEETLEDLIWAAAPGGVPQTPAQRAARCREGARGILAWDRDIPVVVRAATTRPEQAVQRELQRNSLEEVAGPELATRV